MPAVLERRLNRVVRRTTATAAEVLQTALVVDIQCDPSQQIKIYGVSFGIEVSLAADKANLLSMPCVGFLNLDPSTITGVITPDINGTEEKIFYEAITDGNNGKKTIDYANSDIVNGDRRVTFVLYPPFSTGAFGATATFSLLVRGEITQIEQQDKQRIGPWIPR